MSRRIVGYRNGRAVWSDDGPAVGRVAGHGGIASGFWTGTITARAKRDAAPKRKLPRQKRREGVAG